MIEAVKTCFQKYFQFSGRARRKEFWYFMLFLFLIQVAMTIVNSLLFGPELVVEEVKTFAADGTSSIVSSQKLLYNGGALGSLAVLATLIPAIAATWRRMHDISFPGWACLVPFAATFLILLIVIVSQIGLTPMLDALQETGRVEVKSGSSGIGILAFLTVITCFVTLIILLARKSTSQENKYGPVPHGVMPI